VFEVKRQLTTLDSSKLLVTQTWPWRWPNSHHTDYVYAFDQGQIFVSVGNGPWHYLRTWEKETGEKPKHPQPLARPTRDAAEKADGTTARRKSRRAMVQAEIRRRMRGHF
jgi:hypothetical protein